MLEQRKRQELIFKEVPFSSSYQPLTESAKVIPRISNTIDLAFTPREVSLGKLVKSSTSVGLFSFFLLKQTYSVGYFCRLLINDF
jgi:hypothetical protein